MGRSQIFNMRSAQYPKAIWQNKTKILSEHTVCEYFLRVGPSSLALFLPASGFGFDDLFSGTTAGGTVASSFFFGGHSVFASGLAHLGFALACEYKTER